MPRGTDPIICWFVSACARFRFRLITAMALDLYPLISTNENAIVSNQNRMSFITKWNQIAQRNGRTMTRTRTDNDNDDDDKAELMEGQMLMGQIGYESEARMKPKRHTIKRQIQSIYFSISRLSSWWVLFRSLSVSIFVCICVCSVYLWDFASCASNSAILAWAASNSLCNSPTDFWALNDVTWAAAADDDEDDDDEEEEEDPPDGFKLIFLGGAFLPANHSSADRDGIPA